MRLLLVSDTYPPARISGALQMRDLALALAAQGHRPVVLTPTGGRGASAGFEEAEGVQVLRVPAPHTKDVPYWRRTLAEFLLPWLLLRGLRACPLREERWDGVVWYSPTIFLGPLAKEIKLTHGCPGYLIVRDLFPDWAVDAGVMRKGWLAYRFFKAVERFQYRQADVIGVQTPANAPLVARDAPAGTRIVVLHNWLSPPATGYDTPSLSPSPSLEHLQGRINFVYSGNMGVAQDIYAFIVLARLMQSRLDVGFVFVGRGSETARLKAEARALPNLLVLDEIDPAALRAVLAQCHVGIVALHPAHGTHNIPGKLLTYLHAGLPVLARVNPNNDLVALLDEEGIGLAVSGDNPELLHASTLRLVEEPALRAKMGEAGRTLALRMFSPQKAARDIAEALHPSDFELGDPLIAMSAEPHAPRALVAAALRSGELAQDMGGLTVEELLRTAVEEGVLPLLKWRLREVALPPALHASLTQASRKAAAQALFREAELRRVATVLERHGLKTLLLKGNALGQWLYPKPYLRVCGDIDLLLESRAAAEQAVLACTEICYAQEFSPAASNYEMTCRLVVGGVSRSELDLHWRLLNAAAYADIFSFQELWRASLPVPTLGGGLMALCPMHALAHACLNRALDMQIGEPDQLKLLYDIHLLVERMDTEAWEQFLAMVGSKQISGICLRSINDTVAALGSTVPEDAWDALRRGADEEPIDWRRLEDWRYMQWHNVKSLPGTWLKVMWIWDRLFPTRSHLRELHGEGRWSELMGRRLVRGLQRLRNNR